VNDYFNFVFLGSSDNTAWAVGCTMNMLLRVNYI